MCNLDVHGFVIPTIVGKLVDFTYFSWTYNLLYIEVITHPVTKYEQDIPVNHPSLGIPAVGFPRGGGGHTDSPICSDILCSMCSIWNICLHLP